MNREQLAQLFHETYEQLAPDYGYETRKESAVPWTEVPEPNKRLMCAVAGKVLAAFASEMSDAGKWVPPDYVVKPVSALGIPPMTAWNNAVLHATTGHSSTQASFSMDGGATWSAIYNEQHVAAMIADAVEAAEDRIVERVFAMLHDRLRIAGKTEEP